MTSTSSHEALVDPLDRIDAAVNLCETHAITELDSQDLLFLSSVLRQAYSIVQQRRKSKLEFDDLEGKTVAVTYREGAVKTVRGVLHETPTFVTLTTGRGVASVNKTSITSIKETSTDNYLGAN